MSWLCPSIPSQLHTLPLNKTIQYEYRKVDPKTKLIMNFISEDQDGNRSGAYDDCRKIKMESPKVRQLINEFRKNNAHFIDIEFLHHNFSLSSEQFSVEIQWLRVTEIIDNAVYAKQQHAFSVQNLNINRKAFANALVMVSKCNPSLFKQLISKTLNQEGIYEYKLFRDGYIRNVLIDDYVPVLKGSPMFVGPVRVNQVYPMLIEKALAKVCGSYEDIPQDSQQILQMLLCGPVNRYLASDLRKQWKLVQKMQESILKKQIVILVSKQENKVRNYGLNQGEIYQVINKYEINWQGQNLKELQESKLSFTNQSNFFRNTALQSQFGKMKMEQSLVRSKLGESSKLMNQTSSQSQIQNIFECVSENKISAWNGRYSLNDSVWQKVSIEKKMQIYKQLNNNRSFVISQSDIAKHFQQLLILQPVQINSKDWIQNQSHNSFLSFSSFQVTQQDSVFIRVTTRSKLKHTLILAREVSYKKYQFVQSAFTANSNTLELRTEVRPGKYIIAVMHEWFVNKSGMYYIFLESKTHTYLQKGGINDKDFLNKVLFNKEQVNNSNKQVKQECTIHLQLSKLGLGYIIMRPENTKNKTLCMLIDQASLKKDNWEVLQPYHGLSEVVVTQKSEQTSKIIVLSKIDLDLKKKNYFPTSSFVIKK